jgi:chitin disaccharide deacetylase
MLTAGSAMSLQAAAKVRLIVQGDDMGVARAVNEGSIVAYREGVMRSTNVIVPGAWFLDAVRMLNENPGLDVGVHLCLSSEWDRVKWGPLTKGASLADRDGYFPPLIRGPQNSPRLALAQMPFKLGEVEAEFRAQIEAAKRHIPRVSYLWGHMGCTSVTPEVAALTEKLSAEYGLPVPGPKTGAQGLRAVWKREMNADERAAAFVSRLEELKEGTYLFVEHASLDTPESRAMGHAGYEDVAKDRQAVLDAWRHKKVRDAIQRLNIELTGHKKS